MSLHILLQTVQHIFPGRLRPLKIFPGLRAKCFSLTEFQNSEHLVQNALCFIWRRYGKQGRQFRILFEYSNVELQRVYRIE